MINLFLILILTRLLCFLGHGSICTIMAARRKNLSTVGQMWKDGNIKVKLFLLSALHLQLRGPQTYFPKGRIAVSTDLLGAGSQCDYWNSSLMVHMLHIILMCYYVLRFAFRFGLPKYSTFVDSFCSCSQHLWMVFK